MKLRNAFLMFNSYVSYHIYQILLGCANTEALFPQYKMNTYKKINHGQEYSFWESKIIIGEMTL